MQDGAREGEAWNDTTGVDCCPMCMMAGLIRSCGSLRCRGSREGGGRKRGQVWCNGQGSACSRAEVRCARPALCGR